MPTCPNDATEMVSTAPRTTEGRTAPAVGSSRCCPECGYAE